MFDAWQRWQLAMERNPVEFLGRRSAALLAAARAQLAAFVGAQAEHLVFVPNATTGVNIVARSLPLQPGDEVLATDHEYGACDATWQLVCAQRGAVYRQRAGPAALRQRRLRRPRDGRGDAAHARALRQPHHVDHGADLSGGRAVRRGARARAARR